MNADLEQTLSSSGGDDGREKKFVKSSARLARDEKRRAGKQRNEAQKARGRWGSFFGVLIMIFLIKLFWCEVVTGLEGCVTEGKLFYF